MSYQTNYLFVQIKLIVP